MGLQMKYVVVDNGLYDLPVIFPETVLHNEMAFKIGGMPLRAGFVKVRDGEVICYGESISLDLKSDPVEDAKLISRFLIK